MPRYCAACDRRLTHTHFFYIMRLIPRLLLLSVCFNVIDLSIVSGILTLSLVVFNSVAIFTIHRDSPMYVIIYIASNNYNL